MSREEKKEESKITSEEWRARLESIKISKTDMNRLILNYLCLEGYRDAAKRFEKESGLVSESSEAYAIDERKEIRELIQKDMIDEAIDKLNDLCPEVLPPATIRCIDPREEPLPELQAAETEADLADKDAQNGRGHKLCAEQACPAS